MRSGTQTRETSPVTTVTCRSCDSALVQPVVDLGMSPLCQNILGLSQLNEMEPFYPLKLWVCDQCWLVQLEEYVSGGAIFTDYAYFSAYSRSWLDHARRYVHMMIERLDLGADSFVVEVASNDGYLLQYFVENSIPCLGIEPAKNVAPDAERRGVPTLVDFFGRSLAEELATKKRADLITGNNVLAQVPDINDFVSGLAALVAPTGMITIEFPHLLRTIEGNQFDQIYHEHFSYFSLIAVEKIMARHGLVVVDVEELPTHGGSLRIFVQLETAGTTPAPSVAKVRQEELDAEMDTVTYYQTWQLRIFKTKRRLVDMLNEAADRGARVVGYGAPGKGNTLLNFCGIRSDLVEFTVDRNPHKQGKYLPGSHIPVYQPDRIDEVRPDYLLVLPWNLRGEIFSQMNHIRDWGGRFIIPIPEPEVL